MRNLKRIGTVLMAMALVFTWNLTAFAAVEDTGFSDVAVDAWYADAVAYVRDNGLMSGTSAATFEPDGAMTRAMLAATVYRAAGSPAVSGTDSFTDTADGAWYADAVLWAARQGIISGYGNGLFGPGDPVSREQIAAILWRYAGSPAAEAGTDFADEEDISNYAAQAVDWARANGVVDGVDGNRFLPQDNATRAQVAAILRNYRTMTASGEPEAPEEGSRVLVAYFSATGNTESVELILRRPPAATCLRSLRRPPTPPTTSTGPTRTAGWCTSTKIPRPGRRNWSLIPRRTGTIMM